MSAKKRTRPAPGPEANRAPSRLGRSPLESLIRPAPPAPPAPSSATMDAGEVAATDADAGAADREARLEARVREGTLDGLKAAALKARMPIRRFVLRALRAAGAELHPADAEYADAKTARRRGARSSP